MPTPVASDGDTLEHGRFDVYTRLLKDRIVFLGTDVNDEMANFIIAQMLFLRLLLLLVLLVLSMATIILIVQQLSLLAS